MKKLSRWGSQGRHRSMCFAAPGRLQGISAKLLLARRKSRCNEDLGQFALQLTVNNISICQVNSSTGVKAETDSLSLKNVIEQVIGSHPSVKAAEEVINNANSRIGLVIRIPLFDGMKNKYNLSQAHSAVTSLSYETEFTKRNISNELSEAEAYMFAAEKKVSQFELQLSQAVKAYSLAETSFKSGMITNLDLLDANTSVSESSLLLLKARIDYAASVYKLKGALGERIY